MGNCAAKKRRQRLEAALERQSALERAGLAEPDGDMDGALSSGYGHSGHGGGGYGYAYVKEEECPEGISEDLALLVTAAAIAAGAAVVFRAITQAQGRRKRRDDGGQFGFGEALAQNVFWGLEEFEDKIDKIASNGDNADDSWIGNLYKKFKGSFIGENSIDGDGNMDGLEPPILDEKWGLEDVQKLYPDSNNSTDSSEHTVAKRSLPLEDPIDDEEEQEEDEFVKGLTGENKCKTKFWRCIAKVVKGGAQYLDAPGGVSGVLQKTMFRMAFHGGFGNVWNALMTIPEARNVKRCMNSQDTCLSYEALRKEVSPMDSADNNNADFNPRLIVNPEYVEQMDKSDGATQWDKDVEEEVMNNL